MLFQEKPKPIKRQEMPFEYSSHPLEEELPEVQVQKRKPSILLNKLLKSVEASAWQIG